MFMLTSIIGLLQLCGTFQPSSSFFINHKTRNPIHFNYIPTSTHLFGSSDDDAFSFGQRIESVKSGVVGALSGGIALAPISASHDILFGEGTVANGLAQWEFDTDTGSLQAALFAIVYRYCIRQNINPMLNQGIISAFAAVRTLSKVQIPDYCGFAPLDCGSPLGYLDWNLLYQLTWGSLESFALFGVAASAMDYCFSRGIISKFRG